MYSLSSLSREFVKNVVSATLALLVVSVISLASIVSRMHYRIEAARVEMADIERRCAAEKDALRMEQITIITAALKRQQAIEEQLRAVKKHSR